jgi:peptidyl-prolyl cis-trans isomerase B (cyclophilin B)
MTAWQPTHRPENLAAQARDPLVAMSAPPGHPPAQAAVAYDPYSKRPTTNGLAIASLICAFIFPLLAVIFGHLALHQIKHSAQQGRGIAVAGLLLGYLFTVLAAVAACAIYLVFRYLDGLYWSV